MWFGLFSTPCRPDSLTLTLTPLPSPLQIQVSSLFVAGWAGLTVNALNLLPTGELDGGRMALGLFGRR
jgi:Zn-dependent protease